jgi:hypothetical protein
MGAPVEGHAESDTDDLASVEQQAMDQACESLKATGVDCQDRDRVIVMKTASTQVADGKMHRAVDVRLLVVRAVVRGSSDSKGDWMSTCLAAVESACKTAPAGTRCNGDWTYCRTAEGAENRYVCGPTRKLKRLDPNGAPLRRSIFREQPASSSPDK